MRKNRHVLNLLLCTSVLMVALQRPAHLVLSRNANAQISPPSTSLPPRSAGRQAQAGMVGHLANLSPKGSEGDQTRNPFLLPPGISSLTKKHASQELRISAPEAEARSLSAPLPSLTLQAVLLGDHVRLALINRQIVSVGDLIHGEKVFEINEAGVTLEKAGNKRKLFLPQSPIRLHVND